MAGWLRTAAGGEEALLPGTARAAVKSAAPACSRLTLRASVRSWSLQQLAMAPRSLLTALVLAAALVGTAQARSLSQTTVRQRGAL